MHRVRWDIRDTIPPGTYYVGFFANAECGGSSTGGTYIPQYYDDKSSLQSATAVLVNDGSTTSGINAAMRPGNAIQGVVTNASTHAAIEGVEVDVYDSRHNFVASTCTGGANGAYHVWVAFGTYEVGFATRATGRCASTSDYLPQFYNRKSSLATADPVSVSNALPALASAALRPAGAPTVTSVSPNSGPTAGGNTVTITGMNFVAGASVKFGTATASAVTLVSATKLKVKAPPHAATIVNVRVTTPRGTSAASAADHYHYT